MAEESAIRNPQSAIVFVALGSNLGDSHAILLGAMERLQEFSAQPIWKSSLWRSTPVDCPPDSPMFLNAVLGLGSIPGETPESVLAKLQLLEKEFGRRPKQLCNEPRPLDLDLIAFGGEIRSTPALTLPHPRAHLRRFVLAPFNEIAPHFVLPLQSKTVGQLLTELHTDETIVRI